MERRSAQQNRAVHALITALARHFPGVDASELKIALCVYFPLFLAEADGRPMPEPGAPESTSAMTPARCGELIECLLWLGAELGVQFRHDD